MIRFTPEDIRRLCGRHAHAVIAQGEALRRFSADWFCLFSEPAERELFADLTDAVEGDNPHEEGVDTRRIHNQVETIRARLVDVESSLEFLIRANEAVRLAGLPDNEAPTMPNPSARRWQLTILDDDESTCRVFPGLAWVVLPDRIRGFNPSPDNPMTFSIAAMPDERGPIEFIFDTDGTIPVLPRVLLAEAWRLTYQTKVATA